MPELVSGALQKLSLQITPNPSDLCCICGREIVVPEDSPLRQENSATWKCPDCERSVAEKIAARKKSEIESSRNKFLDQVPVSFRRTERGKLPFPEKLDAALNWNFGSRGLLLFGPTGCGKSRVIWEVAKREIGKGIKVRCLSAYELIRYPAMFMAGDDAAGKFAEELVEAQLLLLDDVFKAKPTERIEELLFTVIESGGRGNGLA